MHDDPRHRFLSLLDTSLTADRFVKLVLAKPHATAPDLERVLVRRVLLRDVPHLSIVYRHTTKDITKNLPLDEARTTIDALLGEGFRNAHLLMLDGEAQLAFSKKGRPMLSTHRAVHEAAAPDDQHNRAKQRWLSLDAPFLAALGVTTAQHALVPAMARKWKQINKFVEVFAHALASSALADAKALHVADFGSGKGYLTFAVHHWLRNVQGIDAHVTGVELRPDMVALCNGVVAQLGLEGLHIEEGDVRHWQADPQHGGALHVVIALHACDIATDHAIHLGIRAGAQIILCSPCCHKQVRPQLLSPHPLRPILQHGIHADQQAEMLTDGLRALLLEAAGYDTKVFEFVSLEHTNKNKMILAVKRGEARPAGPLLVQIDELKRFYGVREQALESLLKADGLLAP